MKGLWSRVRSAWRVRWRSRQLEAEMQEEMRFHIETEAERLVRVAIPAEPTLEVSALDVGLGMFEAYGAEMLAGRGFNWRYLAWDCSPRSGRRDEV